jgi:hypothetical protein
VLQSDVEPAAHRRRVPGDLLVAAAVPRVEQRGVAQRHEPHRLVRDREREAPQVGLAAGAVAVVLGVAGLVAPSG